MRMQPIVVLVLAVLLLIVVLQNQAPLGQQVILTFGAAAAAVSIRDLLLIAAAGWVFVWLAGIADVASAGRRATHYRRVLGQREDELTRVKVQVYDREMPLVTGVESRLVTIQASLDALSRRIDMAFVMPESRREAVEEFRR
jgi:hypothetical protein